MEKYLILIAVLVVVAVVVIIILRAKYDWGESHKRFKVEYPAKGRRVACVGDSNTYGVYDESYRTIAYPAQLQAFLGKDYIVENFGINGATATITNGYPITATKAYKYSVDFQPEIVVLCFGTNDSKKYIWNKQNFITDYAKIIEAYLRMDSVKEVYLCSPIPAYGTLAQIQECVINPEVIECVTDFVKHYNLKHIDLYTALTNKQQHYLPDLIHLQAEGYKIMAETVGKAILA